MLAQEEGRHYWPELGEVWGEHEVPTLRLAGFGGAAVYLRSLILPVDDDGVAAGLGLDIGIMGPDFRLFFLARPADVTFPSRLGRFLFDLANEAHPELSVPALQEDSAGLALSAVGSTDAIVAIEVTINGGLDGDPHDVESLNFETSRAALVGASQAAGRLALFRPPISVGPRLRVGFPWVTDAGVAWHDDGPAEAPAGLDAPVLFAAMPWLVGSRMTGVMTTREHASSASDVVLLAGIDLGPEQDPAVEWDAIGSHLPHLIGGFQGRYQDGSGWIVVIQKSPELLVPDATVGGLPAESFDGYVESTGELAMVDGLMRALWFNHGASLTGGDSGGPRIVHDGIAEGGDYLWTRDDLLLAYACRGMDVDDVEDWTVTQLVRGLLAEACAVPLAAIVAGHEAGCAFPGTEHACEHDVFRDVFAAWQQGRLRVDEAVDEPGGDDLWDEDESGDEADDPDEGGVDLTDEQLHVLLLMMKGKDLRKAARAAGVKSSKVKSMKRRALVKCLMDRLT